VKRNIGKIPSELMPDGGPANSPPSYRVIALESGNPGLSGGYWIRDRRHAASGMIPGG